MRAVINVDRHVSVKQLEDTLHLSRMTIHWNLMQNKIRRVCSAWVPHMLTSEQMNTRIERASEFFEMIADHLDHLDRIITKNGMREALLRFSIQTRE